MQEKIVETFVLPSGASMSGYKGEYIFEKIIKSNMFYEQDLLDKWFPDVRPKVIYDIGANIGNHTVYFATSSSNVKVYAFEPIPDNYYLLEKNIEINGISERVESFQLAVGEAPGIAYMKYSQEGNLGTATIVSNSIEASNYEVNIVTVDSLGLPLPDLIKIDVEGFELFVLKGMRATLEKLSNVSVWIEVSKATAKEVYGFMESLGFTINDLKIEQDNNVIWHKNNASDIGVHADSLFEHLLDQAVLLRQRYWEVHKLNSKFVYEQNKAVDLTEKLKSMTSKFIYEQNKASNLSGQISEKESTISEKESIISRVSAQLMSMVAMNEELSESLIKHLAKIKEKEASIDKIQKELDTFRKYRIIRLMRFFVWRLPMAIRWRMRLRMNRLGKWIYVKLLPYPRIRAFFSKINGRLHLVKNPHEALAVRPISKSKASIDRDKQKKLPKNFNVAMIVDEFSYNSFKYECNVFPIEPGNWKKIFDENEIDLFFCESAWAGVDSIKRPWRGQIYASTNFSRENRKTLLDILTYCKRNDIPTAFWNKEDPAHHDDRIHDFVKTAIAFDHIFTTDIECVKRYKTEHGHKSVHLLMFATQPRLFNPIETYNRTNEIVFAGSWYAQHPARSNEMSQIFDSVLQGSHPLKIYDRHSENGDPNHVFPNKYLPYIHPRLPHDKLDTAYKGSKYALNFNTVKESKTMFARRVFELMSSNTLVISNYARGLENLFGDNVVIASGASPLNISDEAAKREFCLNEVLHHHTYKHRFEQVLRDMGIPYHDYEPSVLFRYYVNYQNDAALSVEHFYQMSWNNKQCVLVVGNECPSELQSIVCRFNTRDVAICSEHYDKIYLGNVIKNVAADYVINSTTSLSNDFVKRALAHKDYLDAGISIVEGTDKYKFKEMRSDINMLIPVNCVELEEIPVYVV